MSHDAAEQFLVLQDNFCDMGGFAWYDDAVEQDDTFDTAGSLLLLQEDWCNAPGTIVQWCTMLPDSIQFWDSMRDHRIALHAAGFRQPAG